MTALLTDNLPLLAIAPNGIKKLRELILELAMRGKLVPQDASDESAGELLLRIAKGKAGSEKKNSKKQNKLRGAGADSAAPYQLPTGWQWSSLAQIAFVNPRNFASDNLEVSFVPMTLIGTRFDGQHGQEFRTWGDVKQGFTHFAEGDIGVAKITPCFENSKACVFAGLRNGLGAGTTELHIVRPVPGTLDARYVLAYLKSPQFLLAGETKMTGTAGQKRLPKEFVEANPFPLPPLSEQIRIVAKVDELMALCDRLEAQQIDAWTAHEYLVKALLESLTQATDAADFAISWQRLSEHFHSLFTTESSIEALKQVLLKLAVMGKLVPQEVGDEPANELVDRLRHERLGWLLGKQDSSPECRTMLKKLSSLSELSSPFLMPVSWQAVHLIDCCRMLVDCHNKTAPYVASGIPIIRTTNIRNREFRFDDLKYIDEDTYEYWSRRCPPESGDILFTREAPMGEAAIIPEGARFCLGQRTMLIRPMHEYIDNRYLLVALTEPHLLEWASISAVGSTVKHLRVGDVERLNIPLPPLAEQRRIVAKVHHLMALCDQLKASIEKARVLSEQLVGVVSGAIADAPVMSALDVVHLSSYLVRELASRPTFGRTAHMKWLFLADQHLGLELDMTYERQAAGPLDKLIYQIEEQAAQSQLYVIEKETLKSGVEKIAYRPDVAIDRAADAGAAELGDKRAELDRLIGLLGGHKTEDLEIVATLYAVWNDSLAEGQQPDDGWLINEFRTNWHKGKERFSPELLAKWLSWMREHRLVPVGKISSTRHQGSLLH